MLKQLFTIVLCGLLFGSLHFVLRKTRLVDVAGSFGARTSKFFATAHAVASPREESPRQWISRLWMYLGRREPQ